VRSRILDDGEHTVIDAILRQSALAAARSKVKSRAVIQALGNGRPCPVVAVDVPSGIDADNRRRGLGRRARGPR